MKLTKCGLVPYHLKIQNMRRRTVHILQQQLRSMHLTVPNIRKKVIKMSPHPKYGNMYKGFFCKHKTLNETVALQCCTFLFYIIRWSVSPFRTTVAAAPTAKILSCARMSGETGTNFSIYVARVSGLPLLYFLYCKLLQSVGNSRNQLLLVFVQAVSRL